MTWMNHMLFNMQMNERILGFVMCVDLDFCLLDVRRNVVGVLGILI